MALGASDGAAVPRAGDAPGRSARAADAPDAGARLWLAIRLAFVPALLMTAVLAVLWLGLLLTLR